MTEKDLEAIRYLAEHEGTNQTLAVQRALHLSRSLLEEVKRGAKSSSGGRTGAWWKG